ncbi:MAG: ABC transporter permease [Halieaceae bacterium]|nr:ABC transporter permease [Halieaceae bacterium]
MKSEATVHADPGRRSLCFAGDWDAPQLPPTDDILETVSQTGGDWTAELAAVGSWDSRLTALLLRLERKATATGGRLELSGAPEPQQRSFALATSVTPPPARSEARTAWLSRAAWKDFLHDVGESFLDSLAFLGEALTALLRTLSGRGALRGRELIDACYRAGPDALGIIALTSILVGMILAYLGAAQLQQFGAALYVADLVAIGMLREMGALMTAVVMAGRTGAAYAAQLSTMQGNEEIDAIRTLGIDPMEYLVAPRIIGLLCMMPLLVILADVLGIVGGALVAGGMGVSPLQYLTQLEQAIAPAHFLVGMLKAVVFAALIAIAGCRAGMGAGRSSAAVGEATTEAVVTAVVYLIIADAAINILCQELGV